MGRNIHFRHELFQDECDRNRHLLRSKLSSGRHRRKSRRRGGRSLRPASGRWPHLRRSIPRRAPAWEGAVTRTPCEAGTRRARKTLWRQNRALRPRGGNFSNRAALGVRPAGQALRMPPAHPLCPAVAGGPGSRRHPSLRLISGRRVASAGAPLSLPQRKPAASGARETGGHVLHAVLPARSLPGEPSFSPITSHLGLRGISRRPRRAAPQVAAAPAPPLTPPGTLGATRGVFVLPVSRHGGMPGDRRGRGEVRAAPCGGALLRTGGGGSPWNEREGSGQGRTRRDGRRGERVGTHTKA
ncbi:translation initiation factor IF-2-like [Passer montanus]|uniref:translation initiation factor IF-2-like n=1 Tax=Passer montanus TaxID=9160 RepID=UPI00196112DB|nr:translation initiation factor IF-2-like [Passer montanus]